MSRKRSNYSCLCSCIVLQSRQGYRPIFSWWVKNSTKISNVNIWKPQTRTPLRLHNSKEHFQRWTVSVWDVFVPELWRTETWTEPDFSWSPPCEKHIWKTLASCVGVFRHKNWTKWFLGQWISCGLFFFLFEEQLRTVMSDISWKLYLVNRIRNKQVESHSC